MPARLRSTNVYYNTQEEAQAVADRLNQNNVQTVPRVGEPGNEIPGQTSAAPQTSPRPQPRPDMNLQGPAGGDMNLQGRTAQAAANAQDFTLSGNLRRGSSGPEVEQLQRALGFQDAEIDGRFGPRTEQAVRTFQQNQGLQVDGIVGRQTYNKILQTREDPRAQRNAGVGRIGQPTQQNQSKNNTGNKLTEAKEILRVTKLAGVPMRDIMNIITEANLSADEIRQLAQRLDDEDFTALQQARSGAGAAATAGNAQRLEVLDPQPPGYGFDQGQVLARNSEGRIYNINVSREVRIPFGSSQGQAGYRANSIPGTYQYDPANPQAPGMQNADNIYIPKDQLGQRGGQLAAPEPERQRQRSDAPQPTGPFTQDPEAGDGPEPSQTPDDFRLTQTLRRGSRGEQVRQLQTALGMTGNEVDGVFGPATEQAVRRFQQDRGIQVDGIVGQQTYNSILSTRENPRAQRNVAPGRIGQPTQQNQSIDMTGKEMAKLDEASLTVNGSASEISELMRMMQLAGAPSAKPVDSDDISSHIHNPEPSPCGAKPEPSMGDMISMISKEEEEVDGDFQDATTEPDNYYQDVSASIPSGNDLNRPKDRKAIRTVDPALETTLKDSLLQAYEGKYKSDAQRKAIWASKSEKKK
jgi:peptidoglycan hydrolase-like protein with peptidoglycan-binding domain